MLYWIGWFFDELNCERDMIENENFLSVCCKDCLLGLIVV